MKGFKNKNREYDACPDQAMGRGEETGMVFIIFHHNKRVFNFSVGHLRKTVQYTCEPIVMYIIMTDIN